LGAIQEFCGPTLGSFSGWCDCRMLPVITG
jgi:hypothetical protein